MANASTPASVIFLLPQPAFPQASPRWLCPGEGNAARKIRLARESWAEVLYVRSRHRLSTCDLVRRAISRLLPSRRSAPDVWGWIGVAAAIRSRPRRAFNILWIIRNRPRDVVDGPHRGRARYRSSPMLASTGAGSLWRPLRSPASTTIATDTAQAAPAARAARRGRGGGRARAGGPYELYLYGCPRP
jgi:hypothetical protein